MGVPGFAGATFAARFARLIVFHLLNYLFYSREKCLDDAVRDPLDFALR